MKVVIALGGNALIQRNQGMSIQVQRENARIAAEAIARVAEEHEVAIVHGNGPQVGLLALQGLAYADKVDPYPLDVLNAETQGMIGCIIQQELQKVMPRRQIVTLMTQVVVDEKDPAFSKPTKPIGLVYKSLEEVQTMAKQHNWFISQDGDYFRRVVPSPQPKKIVELEAISDLIDNNFITISVEGGGIPVIEKDGSYKGAEAVIDKDAAGALLAKKLHADAFLILTDVEGIYSGWNTKDSKLISEILAKDLRSMSFASGSMEPKVQAICDYVSQTHGLGCIGKLQDALEILQGKKGTTVKYK